MLITSNIESVLQNGIFFITICTRNRKSIFSEDVTDFLILSEKGVIAKKCWLDIPKHFNHVDISDFIVMPNHIHGIIGFNGRSAVSKQYFSRPIAGSLITIIKSYKSAVTKNINQLPNYVDYKTWQKGYYEHRIRDINEFYRIQKYIKENPRKWFLGLRDI